MTIHSISTNAPHAFTEGRWNPVVIVGRHIALVEWLLLAAAAPLLLFPSQYTLVGAGLIAVAWLTRRVATGRWSVPSAAHTGQRVFSCSPCC